MAKIPIECCRKCRMKANCSFEYEGKFPPCHDILVAENSTCNQQTKVQIVSLVSKLEDNVANGIDCHKLVTKLKHAAQQL